MVESSFGLELEQLEREMHAAREYGLNISKISENALKHYIERLGGSKNSKGSNPGFLGTASFACMHLCDGKIQPNRI